MQKWRVVMSMMFLSLFVIVPGKASSAESSHHRTETSGEEGFRSRGSGTDSFRYVGCWRDDGNRTLTGASSSAPGFMTNRACREYCRERGFNFAGTQLRNYCFCGNSYDRLGQAPEPECNTPCDGNKEEMCGGSWRNSVFSLQAGGSPAKPAPADSGRPNIAGNEAITVDGRINLALNRPSRQSSRYDSSRTNDAQGAVDGVKNGGFGFHTAQEQDPWWQVDLGALYALGEVRIFNRMDCCGERTRTLRILLSDDGSIWRAIYRHSGSPFGGATVIPSSYRSRGKRHDLSGCNWRRRITSIWTKWRCTVTTPWRSRLRNVSGFSSPLVRRLRRFWSNTIGNRQMLERSPFP